MKNFKWKLNNIRQDAMTSYYERAHLNYFSFLLKNSMYCKSNHVTIFYVLAANLDWEQ